MQDREEGWVIGLDPETEWAKYPKPGPYATREEAIAALKEDPDFLLPDVFGNRPNPWVMKLRDDCTCYGRYECAVCITSKEYILEEIVPNNRLEEALEDLSTWWENETDGFRELVLRILASLPGGESLEGVVEPYSIGWKEVELLGNLLVSLQNAGDVEKAISILTKEEEV